MTTADETLAQADRLAAALLLVLRDAHPIYPSTAKWHGGVGGQAITSHCSLTQGAPPGDEWAEADMPTQPLRDYLLWRQKHVGGEEPDLAATIVTLKAELRTALLGPQPEGPTA